MGLTTLLVTLACGADQAEEPLERWTLSPQVVTSVGALDGESSQLFQRITDVDFLAGGGVVVADGGLSVIRVFGPDGAFVREMGGSGEGPGEFLSLRAVWVTGRDTIGVWDSDTYRLTYFGPDGSLLRTVTLDRSGEGTGVGNLDFMGGPLADGSVAIASLGLARADGTGRDRVSAERFDQTGRHLGRALETTGFERARLGDRLGGPIPFSPFPRVVAYGAAIYYTQGYAPTVFEWSSDGERSIRFPANTEDPGAAWTHLEAEVRARELEMYVQALPTSPRPDSIPSIGGIMADDSGRVWAKQYDARRDALWLRSASRQTGGSWWVADPAGQLVATVEMPGTFAPLRVRGERVVGVSVGEFGIERVEVRSLDVDEVAAR